MSTDTAITALLNTFAFCPFTRIKARGLGLEDALRLADGAGRVRFVRCIGSTPDGKVYNADMEQYRILA